MGFGLSVLAMTNNPDVSLSIRWTNPGRGSLLSLKADYLSGARPERSPKCPYNARRRDVLPSRRVYWLPSGRRLRKRCSGGYFPVWSRFPDGDRPWRPIRYLWVLPYNSIWQPSRLPEYFRHRQLPEFCAGSIRQTWHRNLSTRADSGHYPLRSGGVRTFRMLVLPLSSSNNSSSSSNSGIGCCFSSRFLFGNHQGVECCNLSFCRDWYAGWHKYLLRLVSPKGSCS